jgi:hypothetical protein
VKIAVCFNGQMRTALKAAPNLKRYFGELMPNIDFFIHTWDVNQYKHYGTVGDQLRALPPWRPYGYLGEKDFESIPPEMFTQFGEIWNAKKIIVESYTEYFHKRPILKDRFIGALYHSWAAGVKAAIEYSVDQNNFGYDVIVKMRPDMIFPYTRSFSAEIDNFLKDPDAFYIDNFEELYWIANPKNMLAACAYGDKHFVIRKRLSDYIEALGIRVKSTVQNGYAPLRKETEHLNVLTQFPEIFYLDHFWYSTGEPMVWEGEG